MTSPVAITQPGSGDGSLLLHVWALTTASPDGAPISAPEWADRTWQATSAAYGGATLNLQGSNDGVNWFSLSNAAGGTVVALSAPGGAATIELPLWVRPNLTTPGTAAVIAVTMLARRANPMRA
jgi:hypothetical protein